MNKLKIYTVAGSIFTLNVGTLFHFIYEWSGNNYIVGFISPVNESTWEHMKLIFFPMLFYSFYMNYKLKSQYSCVTSALLFSIIIGTFLIPVIFYTYSGILGRNILFLDILTFIISVLIAFYAVYRLTLSCRLKNFETLPAVLLLLLSACFLVFTYNPPDIGIFRKP